MSRAARRAGLVEGMSESQSVVFRARSLRTLLVGRSCRSSGGKASTKPLRLKARAKGETCHIAEDDWPNEVQGYNSSSSDVLADDWCW